MGAKAAGHLFIIRKWISTKFPMAEISFGSGLNRGSNASVMSLVLKVENVQENYIDSICSLTW